MDVSLEVLEGSPPRYRLLVGDQVCEREIQISGGTARFLVPSFSAGMKIVNSYDWLLAKLRRLSPGVVTIDVKLG